MLYETVPIWNDAHSRRNAVLFHVERFLVRVAFPKCFTWNITATFTIPSTSLDRILQRLPQTRLPDALTNRSPSMQSEIADLPNPCQSR
jgi:hypothetical protein